MQFFPLTDNIILATSFLIFIIMSIALVLHGSFKHRFYPSGTVKHNPYSTVIRILKYAFKHKSPEDRSSLTYWEEHTPSRIDLAKNKYGGPFTESDVEDTKTFWRMVAIFCSLGGLFIPYFSTVTQGAYYSLQFQVGYFFTSNYIPFVIWQVFYLLGLLYLPVTELLILPLFPKFEYFLQLITSLKGIGIAIVSLSLALIVILLLEAYGISGINDNDILPCYIRIDSIIYEGENYYHNISFAYFIIPWFFIGIAYFLTTLKSFQFICSQAPNEMCGLLTGVFWFIRSVYICIGAIITYFLTLLVSDNRFTCTFWTILVNLPICFIFSIIFALLARWYNQKQKREESFHVQSVVERYYDKFLSSDYIKEGNNKKFNKYDLPINGWSDETIPIFTNRK
jgi:peptide/histidine transporter 3/4